jgi:hypothetical protein
VSTWRTRFRVVRRSAVAERVSWLVLVYRVPSEPTRLRAAVWRRLKALGAVYLANSVAIMRARWREPARRSRSKSTT